MFDLNLWSVHKPRRGFWVPRTERLHSAHMTFGHRFWFGLPFLRPMATVVAGTPNSGCDADGARRHGIRLVSAQRQE